MRAVVVVFGLLGAATPAWAGGQGSLRASLGGEFDSNAQRAVEDTDEATEGTPFTGEQVADGLVRFITEAQGSWTPSSRWNLGGRLTVGAKRFLSETEQDLLTYDILIRGQHRIGRWFAETYAANKLSRVRNGSRDYSLTRVGLSGGLQLGPATLIVLAEFWEYDFEVFPDVNYISPRLTVTTRWQLSQAFQLSTSVTGVYRDHEGEATELVDGVPVLRPGVGREDRELMLLGALDYGGPFLAGVWYIGRLQRSNSDTENIDRHRFGAYATVGLPWRLYLSFRGALQFNFGRSDTNLRLSGDADENQNSLQVQLRRQVTRRLSVEVGYALFANQFSSQETDVSLVGTQGDFLRQTVFLGVTGYFEGRTRRP
ncbi:MAG: hypothetical protein ACFB9M_18600 [Myxococcota bacterium]